MKLPYFEVDLHANAVYIQIRDDANNVYDTQQITPGINADYDIDGNVIGIEFLNTVMDFGEEFRLFRSADGAEHPGYRDQNEYEAVTQELQEAGKELTGQPQFDDRESGPGALRLVGDDHP
jgi:uncharacterized protein YuzE